MRYRILLYTLLVSLGLCSTLGAQPKCKSQNLKGTWSMSFMGWAIPFPGGPLPAGQTLPIVGLGVATVDHTGKMTGPATAMVGGVAMEFEMDGTFEVNDNCAGIVKYAIRLAGSPDLIPGYVERFVLDLGRNEIISVSVQSPISKPMWLTTLKRISYGEVPPGWPELPAALQLPTP